MFRKKCIYRDLTESERKENTRILVIDDNEQEDLTDYAHRHNWKTRWLQDLPNFDHIDLKDSQIICLDINGIGGELGKKNGLDLLLSIRHRYPCKKYIVYSTQPISDFFHEANKYIDKRIHKQGDFEPFISAFDELSSEIYSWESVCKRLYDEISPYFPNEVDYFEFKRKFEKIPDRNFNIDIGKVAKTFKVGAPILNSCIPIVTQFIEVLK